MISREANEGKDIYKEFAQIFDSVKKLLSMLNEMRSKGLLPKPEMIEELRVDASKDPLKIRINLCKADLIEWEKEVKEFEKSIEKEKKHYYMLFFRGKNFIKASNKNFKHYLRFIDSKINIDSLGNSISNYQII